MPCNRPASNRKGRDFIARHGETVFNIAGRMQGDHPHTPLTRAGFAQADAMGAALRELLGPKPKLTLWSSSAGRALQTLAIIAEHLELDWHQARTDDRLVEIGMGAWSGRYYADLQTEVGRSSIWSTGCTPARPRAANGMTRSPRGYRAGSPTPMRIPATGW
jgi:broad specificity phosphatase PhoE